MNLRFMICLLFAALVTGCTETRTFSLAVRNDTPAPISICLTKIYGADERGWESPEDLASPPHPASDQIPPGVKILPGKVANRESFSGRFDADRGRAILRIYAGTPTLTQMNAISAGSTNRLDVPLDDGDNRFEIKPAEGGGMTALRVVGPWPATQPAQP